MDKENLEPIGKSENAEQGESIEQLKEQIEQLKQKCKKLTSENNQYVQWYCEESKKNRTMRALITSLMEYASLF